MSAWHPGKAKDVPRRSTEQSPGIPAGAPTTRVLWERGLGDAWLKRRKGRSGSPLGPQVRDRAGVGEWRWPRSRPDGAACHAGPNVTGRKGEEDWARAILGPAPRCASRSAVSPWSCRSRFTSPSGRGRSLPSRGASEFHGRRRRAVNPGRPVAERARAGSATPATTAASPATGAQERRTAEARCRGRPRRGQPPAASTTRRLAHDAGPHDAAVRGPGSVRDGARGGRRAQRMARARTGRGPSLAAMARFDGGALGAGVVPRWKVDRARPARAGPRRVRRRGEDGGSGQGGPRDSRRHDRRRGRRAGRVSQNVVLVIVNMAVIRAHPVGAKLGPLLSAIPQWDDFHRRLGRVDPVRDTDWVLINGPSLDGHEAATPSSSTTRRPGRRGRQGHHAWSRTSTSTAGRFDAGVPGVKAALGHADRYERVFLRPAAATCSRSCRGTTRRRPRSCFTTPR